MEPTGSGQHSEGSTDDPRPLGTHGLLLHIGVPKTGTTMLQSCLAASRDALARAGVRYPGRGRYHVPDVRHALGWPATPEEAVVDERRWRALVDEVQNHPGRVIVSAESLAVADRSRARSICEELDRADVRVVVTLRPLHQILASAWQENVKAGLITPFHDWLDGLFADHRRSPTDPSGSWVVHDHAAVVDRWTGAVGPDRVTVVVVDPGRPDFLIRSIERLAGLPDGTLRPEAATRRNRSLTMSETEVLRRVNERISDAAFAPQRRRPVPEAAILELLEGRVPGPDEHGPIVPTDIVAQLRPITERAVERIAAIGVSILGEIDRLVPTDDAHPAAARPTAGETIPIDAAARLVSGLLRAAAASPD